jgi:HdeA/HdeB family
MRAVDPDHIVFAGSDDGVADSASRDLLAPPRKRPVIARIKSHMDRAHRRCGVEMLFDVALHTREPIHWTRGAVSR